MKYELAIFHENSVFLPCVCASVTVEQDRKGQPGKMSFSVIKTDGLDFSEGDACRFCVDGVTVFFGFVFEKSRSGSDNRIIKAVCYDQLYYLKNKDWFKYENKTASEVIQMLADDFGLNAGTIADTGYKIPSRVEDGKTLFDIIQNALDETVKNTGKMYVLYDKAGKLTLSDISDMKLGTLVFNDTAGDFEYKTSIAGSTYNKIRLLKDGAEPVTVRDSENIKRWGVLQYAEKVSDDNVNLTSMANSLLGLYNAKSRTLTVKNVLGDVRVRAGTLLPVVMDLGDMKISNYMLVEQAKHTFTDNSHFMDLKVRGNNFVT